MAGRKTKIGRPGHDSGVMNLKRDKSVMRSRYGAAYDMGDRGDLQSAVGTDVGPSPAPSRVQPGSPTPTDVDRSRDGLSKFEDASFDSVEARISRQHENTRTNVADTGQGNTAPMKESRAIKPADFASVKANAPNPKVSHGNQNPVRSKGKSTTPGDIVELKTAGS